MNKSWTCPEQLMNKLWGRHEGVMNKSWTSQMNKSYTSHEEIVREKKFEPVLTGPEQVLNK